MWCFTCDVRISLRKWRPRITLLLADANTLSVARREFVFRPLRKSSRHTVIFSICASDVSHIGVCVTPFQKQFWQDKIIKFLRVDQELLGIIRITHLWIKQRSKFLEQYVISYVVIFGIHSAELVDIEPIDRARQEVLDGMGRVARITDFSSLNHTRQSNEQTFPTHKSETTRRVPQVRCLNLGLGFAGWRRGASLR